MEHSYFVYMITNYKKTVLYVGVTNDLIQRIKEHYLNRGDSKTFAGKYYCHFLLYFEKGKYIDRAIAREKEIKGWTRKKKEELIKLSNPEWKFLNEDIMQWPPIDPSLRT